MKNLFVILKQNIKVIIINVVSLFLGIFFGYYLCYLIKDEGSDIVSTEYYDESIEPPQSTCDMRVEISGAVSKPNVYCLKSGSILLDLISLSGGYSKDLSKKYLETEVNLARVLIPNEKVYIPRTSEVRCEKLVYVLQSSQSNTVEAIKSSKCVNINTATKDSLMTLSGIGESYAQKIISARPYKNVSELTNVSGIGESIFEKIKNDICI